MIARVLDDFRCFGGSRKPPCIAKELLGVPNMRRGYVGEDAEPILAGELYM